MALAVEISTEELRALLEVGYLYRERGEGAKAQQVFEGVLAVRPDVDVAHVGLGNALQIQGKDGEACDVLEAAAEQFKTSALVQFQLGEFYHTQNRSEEAKAALDEALRLDAHGPYGDAVRAVKQAIDEGIQYTYRSPDAR